MSTDSSDTYDTDTRWDGYSDYRLVSGRIARTVDDAIEAYAVIDARHSEGASVPPSLAADARASILTAAMMLQNELEQDKEEVELYQDILDRWQGEDGFIRQLDHVRLTDGRPGWLYEFVLDIRRAGWQLGYLQAGRTESAEPDDPVERDVEAMF